MVDRFVEQAVNGEDVEAPAPKKKKCYVKLEGNHPNWTSKAMTMAQLPHTWIVSLSCLTNLKSQFLVLPFSPLHRGSG